VLQVQLYNSGSMYGIDGNTYTQGTADFILSQTEALLHGFNTSGGHFDALPPEKVAIGLPACTQAAGGGYVTPAIVASAVRYLRGEGPQPGNYTRTSTYPSLRGLMTWSINWDAVNTCGPPYEFAQNYLDVFDPSTSVSAAAPVATCIAFPDPSRGELTLRASSAIRFCTIIDATGRSVYEVDINSHTDQLNIADLPRGLHTARLTVVNGTSTTVRFVVE
jgi:chitinase